MAANKENIRNVINLVKNTEYFSMRITTLCVVGLTVINLTKTNKYPTMITIGRDIRAFAEYCNIKDSTALDFFHATHASKAAVLKRLRGLR